MKKYRQLRRVVSLLLCLVLVLGTAAAPLVTCAEAATDYESVAQTSWNNVLGDLGRLGKSVTLSGVQTVADAKLADSALLGVTVADGGDGKYIFTYTRKDTNETVDTHTLYVDTEYTLDMSELTEGEKTTLLNDVGQFKGGENNTITVK